jgi:hypothetical protein
LAVSKAKNKLINNASVKHLIVRPPALHYIPETKRPPT